MNAPIEASQMRLVALPRLAAAGRWRVEAMRTLSEPCFLWFTKGQGRITVAGVTRGYTAHNAIYIPPGVMHGFEVGPQVFGTAVFFGRDNTVTLPDQPQHLRIREVHAQQEVNVILDMIHREMDSTTRRMSAPRGITSGFSGSGWSVRWCGPPPRHWRRPMPRAVWWRALPN